MAKCVKSKCLVCGKSFMKKVSNQTYCSGACKRKAGSKKKAANTNVPKPAKATKKVVKAAIEESVSLPKGKEVIIHEGDMVKFVGFSHKRMANFALRILRMVFEAGK